jgi:hypothetical protein
VAWEGPGIPTHRRSCSSRRLKLQWGLEIGRSMVLVALQSPVFLLVGLADRPWTGKWPVMDPGSHCSRSAGYEQNSARDPPSCSKCCLFRTTHPLRNSPHEFAKRPLPNLKSYCEDIVRENNRPAESSRASSQGCGGTRTSALPGRAAALPRMRRQRIREPQPNGKCLGKERNDARHKCAASVPTLPTSHFPLPGT